RAAPERIEVLERLAVGGPDRPRSGGERARPVILDDRAATAIRLRAERRENFDGGVPIVKRRNERLNDGDGAVERSRVAPAFQRMRVGYVPLAQKSRLVGVEPVVDREIDLL